MFYSYNGITSFLIRNVNDFIPKMEYNISMEKFAQRLKELRIDKGLSIQALSKEVKIGVASICRWENQQADVKGTQLVTLAKFFDVTIDYLMGLED